jgi:hypothetical protein
MRVLGWSEWPSFAGWEFGAICRSLGEASWQVHKLAEGRSRDFIDSGCSPSKTEVR